MRQEGIPMIAAENRKTMLSVLFAVLLYCILSQLETPPSGGQTWPVLP